MNTFIPHEPAVLVAAALRDLGNAPSTIDEIITAMWTAAREQRRVLMILPPPQSYVPEVLADPQVFERIDGTPSRWRLVART